MTYVSEVAGSCMEGEGIPTSKVGQVWIACFDKLGTHWSTNYTQAVRIIADAVSAHPQLTAALIIAPNVGLPGSAYGELAIQQAEDTIDTFLREDHFGLNVVRGFLPFDTESLGQRKCSRPGGTSFWFLTSSQRQPPPKQKELVSHWKDCFLRIRKRTVRETRVLDRQNWVNPCTPLARPGGSENLSKAARSKQWVTGVDLWLEVLRSMVEWMPMDSSWGLVLVDMFPYDGKMQKAVVNWYNAGPKTPATMIIGPVWAKMATAGTGEDAMDNHRILAFCKKEVTLHVEQELRAQRLKIEGVALPSLAAPGSAPSPPSYDEKLFVVTCPNASGFLPVRQDCLCVAHVAACHGKFSFSACPALLTPVTLACLLERSSWTRSRKRSPTCQAS